MPDAAVSAVGLSKRYGEAEVFRGLSFAVEKGGSLVFLGPSGCGKTTVLNILQGLTSFDSGTLALSPSGAVRSLVMQAHGLFPWKTAWKNLELPLLLAGAPACARREKARQMFSDLGLAGLEERYPAQLSGGQRQRLALGRSLIMGPDLLFLDEPFSALDEISRGGLERLLVSLWKRLRLTMVLATHSVEEAVLLGESIVVLGGSPTRIRKIFANPGAGAPGADSSEESFQLLLQVRKALRESGSD